MTDVRAGRTARRGAGVDLDALAELEEERRFLLRSLADLDREHAAGDLDELDYTTLRDDYTARAAVVLHAIEEGRSALPAPAPTGRRRRRTLIVIGATVLLAAVAGLVANAASGTRLPGESATGSITSSSTQLLSQARLLLGSGDLQGSYDLYGAVLATNPDNVEALAWSGWLQILTGLTTQNAVTLAAGEASVERAIALKPDYPDSYAFKAAALLRGHNDPAGARTQFELFLANDPPPELRTQFQGAMTQAAQATATPTTVAAPAPAG